MHIKQIEAFVYVVKLKSFSKAAETIYLSQPTISAHVSALEKELDTKLIVRSTKEVYPSKAGKTFYEYAVEILKLRDRAILAVKNFATEVRGELEVSASTVPSQYILPEVLPGFKKEYPNISFLIRQYDSSEVVDHILNMDTEIGITGTVVERNKCIYESFLDDQLVIITPNTPKYQALQPGAFPTDMLVKEPFIMREFGSGTRKESEDFLLHIGIDPKALKIVAQMQGTESVKQAVAKELGIAIISKRAAEDYKKFGMLLTFENNNDFLNRKFYFVYHKDRPLSPVAEAFIKYVREFYGSDAPENHI